MVRLWGITTITLLLVLLPACGWQLRGFSHNPLPDELALANASRMDPLMVAVKSAMRQRAIQEDTDATWQLVLGDERLSKRVVAVTRIGSPSQYELTLTVGFRYLPNDGEDPEPEPLPAAPATPVTPATPAATVSAPVAYLAQSLYVTRVYDFDPANTVAKSEEEGILLEEMRRELAHRILESAPVDG